MNKDFKPEDKFPTIGEYLLHIFWDKRELFYEYLSLLVDNPKQKLPVIILSGAQGTGKTTFLRFLEKLIQEHVSLITNDNFKNETSWFSSRMVLVDGVFREEDFERLKIYNQAVLCADNIKNEELHFIATTLDLWMWPKIENERCFWTVKLKHNPEVIELVDKINEISFTEEITNFISFIQNRFVASEEKTRLYFHPNQYKY